MANKKIKYIFIPWVVILALVAIFAGVNIQKEQIEKKQSIKIGVSVYKSNDAFVANIIDSLEVRAKSYEQETSVKINLDVVDAKGSQRTQNDQIKRYISLDYDIICVNIVDRTDATTIIDAAMDAGIPLVFFNREPVYEDILRGDNIYYAGTDAKATAVLQGKILIKAYEKNPQKIDKNNDNKLQYVMLEGELGHQDTIIRTEWSVETLTGYGLAMEKLTNGTANWERNQASALMDQWIATYGEKIEVVLCNNDEMALGAIDALSNAGIQDVAVLGIDATVQGTEAVKAGTLLGTVDCNAEAQGKNIFDLAVSLWEDGHAPKDMDLMNERYVRSPINSVTQ